MSLLKLFAKQRAASKNRTPQQLEADTASRAQREQKVHVVGERRLVEQAMKGGLQTGRGRPRKSHPTVLGGNMYSQVAFYTFFDRVGKDKSRDGRAGMFFRNSLHDLGCESAHQETKAEAKEQSRKRKLSMGGAGRGGGPGGKHQVWPLMDKKEAVAEVVKVMKRTYQGGDPIHSSYKSAITPAVKVLQARNKDRWGSLKFRLLEDWYMKFLEEDDNSLKDKRMASNGRAGTVPLPLLAAVDDFILRLVASKIELDASLLRPFIIVFIKEFEGGKWVWVLEQREEGKRTFECSTSWIRARLTANRKSWRKATNSSGKLPQTWEVASASLPSPPRPHRRPCLVLPAPPCSRAECKELPSPPSPTGMHALTNALRCVTRLALLLVAGHRRNAGPRRLPRLYA